MNKKFSELRDRMSSESQNRVEAKVDEELAKKLSSDEAKEPFIDKPFAYHKPSASGLHKITQLRIAFSTVKAAIEHHCPESRQKSIAITELETAAMWAIKAVVFNDPKSVIVIE